MRKTLIQIITGIAMLTVLGMGAFLTPAARPYQQNAATLVATDPATATPESNDGTRERPLLNPCTGQPFHTIMTNSGFKDVQAQISSAMPSAWVVAFTLASNDEARDFSEHTRTHIGQPLAIVLDGKVLSIPVIQSELITGAEITGNFDREQAMRLAMQIRTGALPVSLVVDSIATTTSGTEVVLAAAPGSNLDKDSAEQTRQIVIRRMQALDIEKPKIELKDSQLVVEVPTGVDPQQVIEAASTRGLLELVDFSLPSSCRKRMPTEGQYILTDRAKLVRQATATVTAAATTAATVKPTDSR